MITIFNLGPYLFRAIIQIHFIKTTYSVKLIYFNWLYELALCLGIGKES